jgi:hypothetical protein
MVLSDSGIFPEYREVTGTPRGVNGPYWALVEERRRQPGGGRAPPPQAQSELGWGAGPPFLLPLSLFLLLLLQLGKGGNLLLLGVGLPPLGAP